MALPAMMIRLKVVAGPYEGATFAFDRHATFLVGRAGDVHLRLTEDKHFSRHHFLLEMNPPQCFLRDLGSRNGTFVNGRNVAEAFLQHGDVISGGNTRIQFTVDLLSEPSTTDGNDHDNPPDLSTQDVRIQPDSNLDLAFPMMSQSPGEEPPIANALVPAYEILDTLGQGTMGVVYLARHQATGHEVALKVMVPSAMPAERLMQSFLREASILSRLNHPRIVRFLDMGLTRDQCFYFAMEYIEQVDRTQFLATLGRSARTRLVCGLICQALSGLTYAHELGFVHRDIKPSNILIGREGSTLGAKLADFGLAKNFEHAGFSGITRQGQLIGTIAFMAPEQAIDACRSAPSVDIYATGATLYQLLAGVPPHHFVPHRDPLLVLLEDEAVPLVRHCPDIPAGLAEVVHRALARNPSDRFPTAAGMARALAPYADMPS